MNEFIITHIIIKLKLDINSKEKPNNYFTALSEMVGGPLPKRHIHSFRQ